jgi:type I restriction enzyme S subunit
LINQRKESICLLDEYLKSTFLEMFGSDLIREKKWKIIQFGEIITDLSDYHANGSYEILREHIVLKNELDYALIVRTTDLENKNFIEGCNYIDEAAYNFLKKSKIYGGEIIINKIGSAGNVYLMPNLNKPVSLGMNAYLLRFKEQANNIFIYYLLTSNFGEKAIQKHVKGAVTKTITKDAIRNIKIPFPPTELQNKFAQIVEKTETHKAQYQQSLQELEKLYGSLSQRAFKGELSFKDEKLMMAAEPDTFYPVNTHP